MIQLATKYRRREKRRTPVTNESNGDVIKAVRWAFSLFRRQFDQVANIEMNRIRSVVGASTILIDSNTRFANTCRPVRRAARLVSEDSSKRASWKMLTMKAKASGSDEKENEIRDDVRARHLQRHW